MLQYLVRHGRSVSNQEGRVQGRADVPLSPAGRRQAAAMADWARGLPRVDEVWSSPLLRARDTACQIQICGGNNAMVVMPIARSERPSTTLNTSLPIRTATCGRCARTCRFTA